MKSFLSLLKRCAKAGLATLFTAWLGSMFVIRILGIEEPFFESFFIFALALIVGFVVFTMEQPTAGK